MTAKDPFAIDKMENSPGKEKSDIDTILNLAIDFE